LDSKELLTFINTMRHIQSLNEFDDLSQMNNYLLNGREKSLRLDTHEIVKDLMTSLDYYRKRLPEFRGRPLTIKKIENYAWNFADIDSDLLNELTMGGIEGEIGVPALEDDDYFTEKRDALINAWSNCNLDYLADMFVDFVEDEILGTDRHFK
jgi:hypothetical protein